MQVNSFDNRVGKNTLLKQFSRWLVASYYHDNHVTQTMMTCADDIDNIAMIVFPKVVQQQTEKVCMFQNVNTVKHIFIF